MGFTRKHAGEKLERAQIPIIIRRRERDHPVTHRVSVHHANCGTQLLCTPGYTQHCGRRNADLIRCMDTKVGTIQRKHFADKQNGFIAAMRDRTHEEACLLP
jgi:hypothetical protein